MGKKCSDFIFLVSTYDGGDQSSPSPSDLSTISSIFSQWQQLVVMKETCEPLQSI